MTLKRRKVTQGELFKFEIGSERVQPPLRERLGAAEKPETTPKDLDRYDTLIEAIPPQDELHVEASWTVEEGKAFEADLPCPCGGTGLLSDMAPCPFCDEAD